MASVKKETKEATNNETEVLTVADEIWNKIKDRSIDIYALPDQVISGHVKREKALEKAVPDTLHLILRSAAVYPALEEALGRVRLGTDKGGRQLVFELSQTAKYVAVKIVPRDN